MAVPTATEDAKAQQAALLQAIAEQGSRGRAFYEQQQQQAQTQRQAAVQSALARAQGQGGPDAPGAPQALQAQLTAQAAAPGDQRAADVAQAKTYFDQDQAALAGANDAYMGQVQAAVPIVAKRAEAEAQAQIRQQALQKQLADLELQRSQISLQQSQLGLEGQREANAAARNRAAQPDTLSVAEQKYLDDQAMQQRQDNAVRMSQTAGSTGNAFRALVSHNPDFASAMADLQAGIKTPAEGVTYDENGVRSDPGTGSDSQFFADFGNDIDLGALQQLLAAYYGVDLGPQYPTSGHADNRRQSGAY